jgi:transposase
VDAIPPLRRRAGGADNRPDCLLADRGYDSHALRAALSERGIEPAIPVRAGRGRGGGADPRLAERWTIERTNAWLHRFRRIGVRYERRAELYLALVQLACAMIISRCLEGAF